MRRKQTNTMCGTKRNTKENKKHKLFSAKGTKKKKETTNNLITTPSSLPLDCRVICSVSVADETHSSSASNFARTVCSVRCHRVSRPLLLLSHWLLCRGHSTTATQAEILPKCFSLVWVKSCLYCYCCCC